MMVRLIGRWKERVVKWSFCGCDCPRVPTEETVTSGRCSPVRKLAIAQRSMTWQETNKVAEKERYNTRKMNARAKTNDASHSQLPAVQQLEQQQNIGSRRPMA